MPAYILTHTTCMIDIIVRTGNLSSVTRVQEFGLLFLQSGFFSYNRPTIDWAFFPTIPTILQLLVHFQENDEKIVVLSGSVVQFSPSGGLKALRMIYDYILYYSHFDSCRFVKNYRFYRASLWLSTALILCTGPCTYVCV